MVRAGLRRACCKHAAHPRGMLLEPWEAVYLPIPKVACTSLKALFAQQIESRTGVSLPRRQDASVLFPAVHKRILYGSVLYPRLFGSYCTFSFVRNPYGRILSFYRNKIESGTPTSVARFGPFTAGSSFRECLEVVAATPDDAAMHHFRSQTRYLTNGSGRLIPQFLGRFEQIQTDLAALVERLGMEPAELARLNASGNPDLERYFDDYTLRLVQQRYAADFDLLGYERLA